MSSIAELVAQRVRQMQQGYDPLGAQAGQGFDPLGAQAGQAPSLGAQAGMQDALTPQQIEANNNDPMMQMAALRYLDAKNRGLLQ